MADPAYIDADGVLTDGEAWVALASTTLTSDTATVTFTNPSDGSSLDWSQFMDLVLICYARSDLVYVYYNDYIYMHLNNITTAFYKTQRFYVAGTTVYADADSPSTSVWTVASIPGANNTAGQFGSSITTIHDINSGKFKTGVSDWANAGSNNNVGIMGVTFQKQDPITEIDLTVDAGTNFKDGSMFSLFGVLPRMVA